MASTTPATPAFEHAPPPTYTGPRSTYKHPQLGDLTGRVFTSAHFAGSKTVQFRSIPFARIPARFAPAVQLRDIPTVFDGRPYRDFTQFGTACPQPGGMGPAWVEPQGGPLDGEVWRFDEFTCLTVSVAVPEAHLARQREGQPHGSGGGDGGGFQESKSLLPVLVYVYGGGATDGLGHVDESHSNAPLAAYAETLDRPVITVNISYRVNWLGALVCQDLLDEYAADSGRGSRHGPFNLTIQDQRTAFAWVHEFIGGFGGNVADITAFGESAGSIFLIYHITGSKDALFKRVILQSGLPIGSLPFEAKEAEYQALLKHLGIRGETWQERLAQLRQVDAATLAAYPGSHMTPFVGEIPGVERADSLFTRGPPTYAGVFDLFAANDWLGDVIVGDDFFEGVVFLEIVRQRQFQAEQFVVWLKSLVPSTQADEVLHAYDIPVSGAIDPNRFLLQLSLLLGDVFFSAPTHRLAGHIASIHGKGGVAESAAAAGEAATGGRRSTRKIYRYSFGLSNPFLGSALGYIPGHHFVEILYVFLTFLDRYSTRRDHWLEKQAKETAKRWILFANGEEPWERYEVVSAASTEEGDGEGKGQGDEQEGGDGIDARAATIAIADDIRGWTVRTVGEDEELSKSDPWGERRYAGWRAIEAAFRALKRDGDDVATWGERVDQLRLKLLTWVVKGS